MIGLALSAVGGIGGGVRLAMGAVAGFAACYMVAHIAWIPAADWAGYDRARLEISAESGRALRENVAKDRATERKVRDATPSEKWCLVSPTHPLCLRER